MLRSVLVVTALLSFAACQPAAPAGPVTESGVLELGDITLASGEYYDEYSVSAQTDQWLTVKVDAEGFDPYLIVLLPDGERSEIDDSEEANTTSVETVVRATSAGTHDIVVTSYEPGESGSYQITYEVSDTAPAGATSSKAPGDVPSPDDVEEVLEEDAATEDA